MALVWPDWLDEVWAKSPVSNDSAGESLACHTWRTLERLKDLALLRPDLPKVAGMERLWHCLFWSCWLHDFGKAADGFQAALRSHGRSGWGHRHEVLSLAFVDWICEGLSKDEDDWVASAILFHHLDPNEIDSRYPNPYEGDSWEDPIASLCCIPDAVLKGLWRWLDVCGESWIQRLGLSELRVTPVILASVEDAVSGFQGDFVGRLRRRLDRVRRWVRRNHRSSDTVGPIVLRGQMTSCDHLASAHTTRLLHPIGGPKALLLKWGMTEAGLFPHQRACLDLQGSAIMVAPTGAGKTEAALLWASSQVRGDGPIPRILYTLPYQASMNAMYDRLNRSSYPDQVGLEHGRSLLALYRRFLEENIPRDSAIMAAHASRNLARLHHQPVRVMSPYQVLKGFYRLHGYESLITDAIGAAFIFDEIHAYEPNRLGMILASVQYLRTQLDARFLVMSATLPSLVRLRLLEILGDCSEVEASPETFAQFQRHRLFIADGEVTDDGWISRIADEGRAGSSVLVCCNTIGRAQDMYQQLNQRLQGTSTTVVLLHGRFNGNDRTDREGLIQRLVGVASSRRVPVIVVATQVVEVSLDVDFDVLYTDPAPLEALVQRFGRVNRRRRHELAPVWVFTQPKDGQGVYDSSHVEAALRILKRVDGDVVREDAVSRWLDEVYSGDIAATWLNAYQRSKGEFEAVCINTLRAFSADEALEELFYQAFDSVQVLPICFEEEYRSLLEQGYPLEALGLCVSVPWRTAHRLSSQRGLTGRWGKGWPRLIDAPYSPKTGLMLGSAR